MKILAVNPGHNGSIAYLEDGELKLYIEEERVTRQKYDGNPFKAISIIVQNGVDVLVLGGTHKGPQLTWTMEDPFVSLVRKFNPQVKVIDLHQNHHLGHAAGAFYNSGFDTAAAVIVDGAGSLQTLQKPQSEEGQKLPDFEGFETESIFKCDINDEEEIVKTVWKGYGHNSTPPYEDEYQKAGSNVTIVKAYEAVSHYLGFEYIEAGKTMGLAPYGKEDENIPDFFINDRGNKNLLIPNYPAGAFIDYPSNPYLARKYDPKEWHNDPDKVTDIEKNIAWKVQQETQEAVCKLIEKAVKMTGEENIVISGGYGLNCVANYYYKERFPNLNIFIDPVSHDGGTTIGLAKFVYNNILKSQDEKPIKMPLNTLYLGLDQEISGEFIESVSNDFIVESASPESIAQLIADKNIVTIFQGRAEAGPRALGNRSILYDPRDPDGKAVVNQVKGREWFRPFAGSMLQEDFEDWFETRGMTESPYMMYAMDFKLEKHGEVPAITHVDGTCRIQTVTSEQNENYYNLIKAFKDITGVPILFNTSFNLAGEPLVENVFDALNTLLFSDLKYLYLPEANVLITVEKNIRDEMDNEEQES